ncbi:MAG: ABC transporter substrate-binding protein [Mogibacterium sp.]|nr:ABC transporter substrate-binding protein [Mogibacterium sp.]
MKRKRVLLTAFIVLICLLAAGCSGGNGETETAEETAAVTEPKPGTIRYLNARPELDAAWQALAAAYTEETGHTVIVESVEVDKYAKELKSRLGSETAPTLFEVTGPVGLQKYRDNCLDLSGEKIYSHLLSDDYALRDGDAVKAVAYEMQAYGLIVNKPLLKEAGYSVENIDSFAKLRAISEDITDRSGDLGFAAFTSAGMEDSSARRFKTYLANLPVYFEFQDEGITSSATIKGTYLNNYRAVWDLYIGNSTCKPGELRKKTLADSRGEFLEGKAVFYQNGSWEYEKLVGEGLFADDDLTMIPIYFGVGDEKNQGLCSGSEHYWCVNSGAAEEDLRATVDFLEWCVTSQTGKETMANEMGLICPFDTAVKTDNIFIRQDLTYLREGRKPVTWNIQAMPPKSWRTGVGKALIRYAEDQRDSRWYEVEEAFIDGWETEYQAANGK